jgi:hypothetical protein
LLRAEPATRSTAIIMVTSAESSEVAERVRAAGADHLLGWPLTSEAVRSAVRAMAARTSPDPSPTVRSLREAVPHRTEGAEGAALPGHRSRVRSFPREQTTNPPRTPPPLICPVCNARLTYTYSHTGGVNAESPEQWDYFQCATCGPFQYRHRTRKVKAT